MNEAWRVLKPSAAIEIFVPSTDGRGAFQDPTHVSFWNANTFAYFSDVAFGNYYPSIACNFDITFFNTLDNHLNLIYVWALCRAIKNIPIEPVISDEFAINISNEAAKKYGVKPIALKDLLSKLRENSPNLREILYRPQSLRQ